MRESKCASERRVPLPVQDIVQQVVSNPASVTADGTQIQPIESPPLDVVLVPVANLSNVPFQAIVPTQQ